LRAQRTNLSFEKIAREWVVIGAILLSIVLLLTSSPVPEKDISNEYAFPAGTELSKVISLDQAPSMPAALLRLLAIVFLTLAVSGIVLNIQGIAERKWRFFASVASPAAGWGVWPVVKLAVYFICILLVFQRLETVFLSLFDFYRAKVYCLLILGNAFFQFALLIFLVIAFLVKVRGAGVITPPRPMALLSTGGPPPDSLRVGGAPPAAMPGIIFERWAWSFRQALRGYILFFPMLVILMAGSMEVIKILGLPFQPHPLVQPILETGNPVIIWPLLAIGILLGPLAEELFFRGLLFPALKRGLSVFWSVIITAALFSSLHLNWAGWLPIFGLGILLAYSYERTGSILVPIFIHMIHNALFLTLTVLLFQLKEVP